MPTKPVLEATHSCVRWIPQVLVLDAQILEFPRKCSEIQRVLENEAWSGVFVEELVVLYSRGSFDMNGFPFISLVRFECDRDSKETGPLEPVADGSKYFLIWRTRAACPYDGPVKYYR